MEKMNFKCKDIFQLAAFLRRAFPDFYKLPTYEDYKIEVQ